MIHPVLLQHLTEIAAKAVIADLADEGGPAAKPGGGYRHVGRRTAGIGGKEGDVCVVLPCLCQVDQDLADGCDVCHSALPSFLLFGRRTGCGSPADAPMV